MLQLGVMIRVGLGLRLETPGHEKVRVRNVSIISGSNRWQRSSDNMFN